MTLRPGLTSWGMLGLGFLKDESSELVSEGRLRNLCKGTSSLSLTPSAFLKIPGQDGRSEMSCLMHGLSTTMTPTSRLSQPLVLPQSLGAGPKPSLARPAPGI